MTITPNELLDTSMAQLRTLAAFLREQLGDGADSLPSTAEQVRACREVLNSLGVLILRVQATREMSTGGGESERAEAYRAGADARSCGSRIARPAIVEPRAVRNSHG